MARGERGIFFVMVVFIHYYNIIILYIKYEREGYIVTRGQLGHLEHRVVEIDHREYNLSLKCRGTKWNFPFRIENICWAELLE